MVNHSCFVVWGFPLAHRGLVCAFVLNTVCFGCHYTVCRYQLAIALLAAAKAQQDDAGTSNAYQLTAAGESTVRSHRPATD